MKKINLLFMAALALSVSSVSIASEPVDRTSPNDPPSRVAPTITLTSFIATRAYRQTGGPGSAELCGVITSGAHMFGADVVTDYQTRSTSTYRVMANEQGQFCVMVMTFTGRVHATVWEHGPGGSGDSRDGGGSGNASGTMELML